MKKAALYLSCLFTMLTVFSCQKDDPLDNTKSKTCYVTNIKNVMPDLATDTRIVYNSHKQIDSVILYYDSIPYLRTKFTYNAYGKVVKSRTDHEAGEYSTSVYTYNTDNSLKSIESTEFSRTNNSYKYKEVYTYNSAGQLIKVQRYESTDESLPETSYMVIHWGADNNPDKLEGYDIINDTSVFTGKVLLEYDNIPNKAANIFYGLLYLTQLPSKNNLIKETAYDSAGKLGVIMTHEYKFTPEGYIRSHQSTFDNLVYKSVDEKTFSYTCE